MDFLEYWRLAERPFESTWDPRFFFLGPAHEEAVNRLSFFAGEESMRFGVLTDGIGCGKTLTRSVFADQLDRRRFTVVTHENSAFNFHELLGLTLQMLNAGYGRIGRNKAARWWEFQRTVEEIVAAERHLVLIFDEAQDIPAATLNELKQLTNLNGNGRSCVTVVLVGQPELRELVARQPAIHQRVGLQFHLPPLSAEDSARYLSHRLLAAGRPTSDLFEPAAVERVFEATSGIPRELNRVAKLALEFAWVQEYSEVKLAAVDAVMRDMNRHQTLAIA